MQQTAPSSSLPVLRCLYIRSNGRNRNSHSLDLRPIALASHSVPRISTDFGASSGSGSCVLPRVNCLLFRRAGQTNAGFKTCSAVATFEFFLLTWVLSGLFRTKGKQAKENCRHISETELVPPSAINTGGRTASDRKHRDRNTNSAGFLMHHIKDLLALLTQKFRAFYWIALYDYLESTWLSPHKQASLSLL